jgi:DNA methylase
MPRRLAADMSPDDIVHHKTWRELLDVVPTCDALIVDAPYSEKTHAGHDDRAQIQNTTGSTDTFRPISYAAWSPTDVDAFVSAWSARVSGWFVSMTDHILGEAWATAFAKSGRYVFAPIPYIAWRGPRVSGDGPTCDTIWVIVARPREKRFLSWGSLPGSYVRPDGKGERPTIAGGKGAWIMERLVEDYSCPGDLVCDPCAGAGSTLVAALKQGRRAIGGDMLDNHYKLAREAVEAELVGSTVKARRAGQRSIFEALGDEAMKCEEWDEVGL